MQKQSKLAAPRLVIAGTNSGAGKTTVTLGIMAALKKRGFLVQGFKCGPDYIDPGYHTALTGRQSRNLDSWFVAPAMLKNIFLNNSRDADISIIEGVMGLFDGRNPSDNHGSTAEISQIINAPVILVLDARSMARSAAAIVKGFQVFSKKINIAAVIANKVGSKNHLEIIREAVEKECGIPVLGGILRDETLLVPERHLGLLPALERGELQPLFSSLATMVEKSLDLELLLKIAGFQKKDSRSSKTPLAKPYIKPSKTDSLVIAVARDEAFNFYYPENLEVMRQAGMIPVFYSPLKNDPLPENACGLYLGGGFPEEFARQLSKNQRVKNSIIQAVENGMPALAECGGFMYLTQEIMDRRGKLFPMTGILPGRVVMQPRLAALGYREISGLNNNFLLNPGETIRGHEFHYSVYEPLACADPLPSRVDKAGFVQEKKENKMNAAYHVRGRNTDCESGLIYKNLVAGYMHLYFLSHPTLVKRWAEKCRQYNSA